jgi:pyrroline-5-carboxylate reductase
MQNVTIGFIGAGNMATSLVGGLIADGFNAGKIIMSDVDGEKLEMLAERFGVQTTVNNEKVAEDADIVVLAIKPQSMRTVCEQIAPKVQAGKPLVISVAAGINTATLEQWLGQGLPVVRTMPNTPALVGTGATALFATKSVSAEQGNQAESIMRAVGLTVWVEDESRIDAVTALSGSGPAYFFYVMEAMQDAAEALGLSAETARLLTLQTALGAAKLAMESDENLNALRHRVTSPGGTTEQAIKVLDEHQLANLFKEAMQAAKTRSEALSAEMAK